MKIDDFINKWSDLKKEAGLLQRINPGLPLNFFIGIDERGFEQIVLFTDLEPPNINSSKALNVEKRKRKDGRWVMKIASVEDKNEDVFAKLCLDLVDNSENAKTEQEGINKVVSRFLTWQKLFATIRETLPISVLKGLIGEIKFLEYLIKSGIEEDMAINSWVGPNGADRDFVVGNSWFEIKSISTGKDKLTISSLNQLEAANEGRLVVYFIDESTKTDYNAYSVSEIINNARTLLNSPESKNIFENNLIAVGYIDKKIYEDIYFNIGFSTFYRVDSTFPRLITNNVPQEIVGVKYDLSLAGIEPWRIGEKDLWN